MQIGQFKVSANKFRLIILPFGLIPLAMMIAALIWLVTEGEKNNLLEIAFLVCGIPIVVIIFAAWGLFDEAKESPTDSSL